MKFANYHNKLLKVADLITGLFLVAFALYAWTHHVDGKKVSNLQIVLYFAAILLFGLARFLAWIAGWRDYFAMRHATITEQQALRSRFPSRSKGDLIALLATGSGIVLLLIVVGYIISKW